MSPHRVRRRVTKVLQQRFVGVVRAIDQQSFNLGVSQVLAGCQDQLNRRVRQCRPGRPGRRWRVAAEFGDALPQGFYAPAGCRNNRIHRRSAEALRQLLNVNLDAFGIRGIEHRQRYGNGNAELKQLLHEVQTLIQIGRINNRENAVRRPHALQPTENDIDRDLFFVGVRAQCMRAGQINQFDRDVIDTNRADMAFNSDARVISDALPQTRQAIEYRAFATVGIADHRYAGNGLPAYGYLADGDFGFFGASHRSRLEQQ